MDFVKINCDGGFLNDKGGASIGLIVKDDKGKAPRTMALKIVS